MLISTPQLRVRPRGPASPHSDSTSCSRPHAPLPRKRPVMGLAPHLPPTPEGKRGCQATWLSRVHFPARCTGLSTFPKHLLLPCATREVAVEWADRRGKKPWSPQRGGPGPGFPRTLPGCARLSSGALDTPAPTTRPQRTRSPEPCGPLSGLGCWEGHPAGGKQSCLPVGGPTEVTGDPEVGDGKGQGTVLEPGHRASRKCLVSSQSRGLRATCLPGDLSGVSQGQGKGTKAKQWWWQRLRSEVLLSRAGLGRAVQAAPSRVSDRSPGAGWGAHCSP